MVLRGLQCVLVLLVLVSVSPSAAAENTGDCLVRPSRDTVVLTGFTRARTIIDVSSEVAGRCLTVSADVGEPVPASGVLVTIDPTFARLDLENARLALQRQQAVLRFDRRQLKRAQALVSSQASARTRLEERQLKVEQDRLRVSELEIGVDRARETLDRHTVKAPAGWLVVSRDVEPGEWVTPGRILARVGDYSHLLIPLSLDFNELNALQASARFALHLPEAGIRGQGRILRIRPAFDPGTRKTWVDVVLTAETMARLPRPRGGLRVEIPVQVPDPAGALLVPARAVQERYEESWLIRADGSETRIQVLGPARTGDSRERDQWLRVVAPRLNPGDRLLCRHPIDPEGQ